jgi:hypothetical protein
VSLAYGWVTIVILSMVKRAHPLYSNKEDIHLNLCSKTKLTDIMEMED